MIERCRTKLAERIGFHLAEMAETQVFPVVVRTEAEADYLAGHKGLVGEKTGFAPDDLRKSGRR